MKDVKKFVVVLLVLALALGLVYSIFSPILGKFSPEETKDKNNSTETKAPSTTASGSLKTEVVEPEETVSGHVHDYGEYVVVTEATCNSIGLKKATCTGCTAYITTEIAKLTTHTYDSGKVTVQPTCAKTGVTTYTCSVCGVTRKETIAKLTTHTYDSGNVVSAPTCAKVGVISYTCKVCGEKDTDTVAKLTTHTYNSNGCCSVCGYKCDHVYDNGETIREATCLMSGLKIYTCSECENTKSEVIPVLTTHSNLVDGVCHDCGYGCDHTFVDTIIWYEDQGDGRHYYLHAPKCTECEYVDEYAGDNEYEAHTFVDGKCDCGATE